MWRPFSAGGRLWSFLLEKGVSPLKKNNKGETAIDVVSGSWSKGLGDFYSGIGRAVGIKIDLERIQKERPKMAELLRNHAAESDQKQESK